MCMACTRFMWVNGGMIVSCAACLFDGSDVLSIWRRGFSSSFEGSDMCVCLVTAKHSRLFDGENMCPFGDSKAKSPI